MSKLIELNDLNADNFIELLRDSDISVFENIQGSKIFIEYKHDTDEFLVRSKNVDNNPLNRIDLAIQKYYQKVFDYLDNLDIRVKKLLPIGNVFMCQYFPDTKPAHIRYDKTPKNNLILVSIIKNGIFTDNYEEICEYSNLLGIESIPLLFKGCLTVKQIELIKYFLSTKKDDLELIFGENNDNFASFFYKILNPNIKNSILMNDGEYQNMLDKIIIKIDNDEISLSILNPLYDKNDVNNDSDYTETYSIILIDFLEYIQALNFNNMILNSDTSDEIYIEIVSDLFNRYIEDRSFRLKDFEFVIPPFFYDDKFKINKALLNNKKTKYLLESSDKNEFIFKVILHSFRNKKNKSFGVFNDNTIKIFNNYVGIIQSVIDRKLKIEREDSLSNGLLDFSNFYKIKYPKGDGENKVYPELYKDLEDKQNVSQKKKKA